MIWTPALLAGGALLALGPIIIHILFRRRYRTVDFAAMRFLLDSMKRAKQRLRLEELIIIALRVVACLLIGLLLANLRGGGGSGVLAGVGGHAVTAHVFVLDDSLSMSQRHGATTLYQKALTHIAGQLDKMNDNDQVAIISACAPESARPLGQLTLVRDLRANDFSRRLVALKPTDQKARFTDALAAAAKLAGTQRDALQHFHIVSDCRQTDWLQEPAAANVRKAFADLATQSGSRAQLTLYDFGVAARTNLTLERIEMLDKLALADAGTNFAVHVKNNGAENVDGATVTVQVGDITLPVIGLPSIAPGETVKRTFRYVLPNAGYAAIKASLTGGDALPGDDHAALALEVFDTLRILIIDGSGAVNTPAASSFYLSHALDPSQTGAFGQRVDVLDVNSFSGSELNQYDALVLVNVRELAIARDEAGKAIYPQLAAIEKFVRAGGGLAIFVGDKINTEFYNTALYADGNGLLPLKLSTDPLPLVDKKTFARLRPDSIGEDPLLRLFREGKFAQVVRIYGFVKSTLETKPLGEGLGTPQVLARLDDKDNSPLVARRSYGKGAAMVWLTAPTLNWTDWPKDLSFLPIMNEMVLGLARSRDDVFNARVGDPLSFTTPAALSDAAAATLKTPAYPLEDVQTLPLKVAADGRAKSVEFAGTASAGLYDLAINLADRTTRHVYFGRSIDAAEAQLARADDKQIAATVGVEHTFVPNLATQNANVAAADTAPRRSYFWWVLGALLAVLGLEVFLAQRFAHYAADGGDVR